MRALKKNNFILGGLSCLLIPIVHAGIPGWTYSAPNPANITISSNSITTVQYTITNQFKKSKNLILKPTAGLSASSCYLEGKGSTCTLTLTVDGSKLPIKGIHRGPVLCEQGNPNQCYQPGREHLLSIDVSRNTGAANLQSSISDLALMVSGIPRVITITNIGDSPATGLSWNQPSWPSGTSVSSNSTCMNGGSLAAGESCTLIITPGAAASSDCTTGISPTPAVLTVSENGGTSTSINTLVLGYGCQYQGGFLFAMDDSNPVGSIKGKVVSLTNQAPPQTPSSPDPGLPWDASLACALPSPVCTPTNANDFYYGQNLQVVLGSSNPGNTGSNGPGNTWLISSILSGIPNNSNTLPATYAAGACISYQGNGYTDWYLPALCDMGPGFLCSSGTQNMVQNLAFLIGDTAASTPSTSCNQPEGPPTGADCFAGLYWSSTEITQSPPNILVRYEGFNSSSSFDAYDNKFRKFGVRCIRDF